MEEVMTMHKGGNGRGLLLGLPANGSGLSSGRLWYAAIVPLLGLYIEIYADSFKLGILVWVTALIMSPAACLLDLRYIHQNGWSSDRLGPVHALLPPLYIFRRTKLTGDSSVCGAVWCIMFVYALVFNDFTAAATLKKSDMTGIIKQSSWSYVSGLSDVTYDKTIEEALTELTGGGSAESGESSDSGLSWNAEKHKGYITVTCKAKDGSLEAEFKIDFDGYITKDYHLVRLMQGGREYRDDEAVERIKELFPNETDESSQDESSKEDKS